MARPSKPRMVNRPKPVIPSKRKRRFKSSCSPQDSEDEAQPHEGHVPTAHPQSDSEDESQSSRLEASQSDGSGLIKIMDSLKEEFKGRSTQSISGSSNIDFSNSDNYKHTSNQRFSETPNFGKLVPAKIRKVRKGRNPRKSDADVKKDGNEEDVTGLNHRGLDYKHPPMTNVYQVFERLAERAKTLNVVKAFEGLKGRPLRIFTACSGTEAPLISLELMRDALGEGSDSPFQIHHVGSAEIVQFKAAYIERNFRPDVIFRDVTEFGKESNMARTIYGSLHPLPEEVDILIAGSACVDYSTMNQAPKDFGEKGESFSTMEGLRRYLKRLRPTLVLLENVKTAPWPDIAKHWREPGYTVEYILLDSKDFGIPHTRQRGYLIAVDNKQAELAGLDPQMICTNWKDHVHSFGMRATSPYTDWTYLTDDPRLEFSKKVQKVTLTAPNRQQAWESSSARHMYERGRLELGNSRPLTRWQESGGSQPTDYLWQTWIKVQRPRILDTLDMNFLRHLVSEGYDDTKKCRTLDLSQNIDRDTDSREWGIIACQTPRGMPYDSKRGGPITGRESCKLQGIPVDDLDLTHESTAELQDLSGNAMTVTVAGPVLVSAIVAAMLNGLEPAPLFKEHSPKVVEQLSGCSRHLGLVEARKPRPIGPSSDLPLQWESSENNLLKRLHSLDAQTHLSKKSIDELAHRAMRLCVCEGYNGQSLGPFNICVDCGHIACSICRGNPTHNYQPLTKLKSTRIHPNDFIDQIKRALPQCLNISVDNQEFDKFVNLLNPFETLDAEKLLKARRIHPSCIPGSDPENLQYQEAVRKALSGVYLFHQVKRDGAWKVEYGSDHGTLELQLTPYFELPAFGADVEFANVECKWSLFAHCDPIVAAGSELRKILADPVATMEPRKDVLEGTWQLRDPRKARFRSVIKGSGARQVAWESSMRITDTKFQDLESYAELVIDFGKKRHALPRSISFTRHKDCGAAQGSLYRSKLPLRYHGSDRFLYFFLDPNPLGDPSEDSFVLSFDCMPKTTHDSRQIIVRFKKGWRATVKKNEPLHKKIRSEYMARNFRLPSIKLARPNAGSLAATWTCHQPRSVKFELDMCGDKGPVFVGIRIPRLSRERSQFANNMHYELDLRERRDRLKEFAYMLGAIGIPHFAKQWQLVHWEVQTDAKCARCAPERPSHTWEWVRKRRSPALILRPFVNDQEAARYEEQLLDRPLPVSASLDCNNDTACLELRLNLQTMVHRVIAPFIHGQDFSGMIEWRVKKYDVLDLMPTFEVAKIQENHLRESALPCVSSFIQDCGTKDDPFKRALWSAQARALSWMIKCEIEGISWSERNKVDAKIAPLAWNVEVRAVVSRTIFGGVLADKVGAGKTTTTLAMIEYFRRNPIMPTPSPSNSPIPSDNNRIKSNASIIWVPKNILTQWADQIKDCYGRNNSYNVVMIPNMKTLKAMKIEALVEADIILAASSILESDAYWESLRVLCCAPNIPSTGGRAFGEWMQEASNHIDLLILRYNKCKAKGWDSKKTAQDFLKKREEVKSRVARFEKFRPFELTKAEKEFIDHLSPSTDENSDSYVAYQMAYPDPLARKKDKDALDDGYQAALDLGDQTDVWPLFHFFQFNRVIVDEFADCKPKTIYAITKLATRSRWLLSGTPPVDSLSGVDAMSRFLGTRVVVDSSGVTLFGFDGKTAPSRKVNEQTYAEEQLSLSNSISQGCLESRHQSAHAFVRSFVRQNQSPMTSLTTTPATRGTLKINKIVVVKPSPIESATHLQVFQLLGSQSMKFNQKGTMHITDQPDRGKAIDMAIRRSENAQHALICSTSALRSLNKGTCQDILEGQQELNDKLLLDFFRHMRETIHYHQCILKRPKANDDKLASYLQSIAGDGEYGDAEIAKLLDEITAVAWESHGKLRRPFVWSNFRKALINYWGKVKAMKKARAKQRGDMSLEVSDEKFKTAVQLAINTIKVPNVITATKEQIDELKDRVKTIHTDTREAVRFGRGVRYLNVVNEVVKTEKVPCDVCEEAKYYSELSISVTCGHATCVECIPCCSDDSDSDGKCRKQGCTASSMDHHLVSLSNFSQKETCCVHDDDGTRNIAILNAFANCPADDNVIIFVQYEVIKDHLVETLTNYGVAYEDAFKTSENVQKFKKAGLLAIKKAEHMEALESDAMQVDDDDEEGEVDEGAPDECPYEENDQERPRILILRLGSPDSAGWNLQVANHVFFAAPFVAESQFLYDTTMEQAIGRVFRFGQKKPVYVYHFAMRRTVEVNILEARNAGHVIVEDRSEQVSMVPFEQWRESEEHNGGLVRLNGPSLDNNEVEDAGVMEEEVGHEQGPAI